MKLQTTVRDCLYLNWALPVEILPEPAPPLRYQIHSWQGRDYAFASALLFHQDALHFSAVPILRFGYPQLNLRFYVLDGEGTPSVLISKMLMPTWMAPGVRLLTHQPASRARLDFPRPSREAAEQPWRWRVRRHGALEVLAWQDSPRVGEGPRLGSWEQTVRYFHERPRGYVESAGALHKIDARHPPVACWPVRAELSGDNLFRRLLPVSSNGSAPWPSLHSAWLCPEIPFVFELGLVPKVQVSPGMPHPAAGRVTSPALRHRPSREAAGVVLASAA